MHPDTELVADALKQLLRRRRVTYKDLARHLGTSEAAVKNMFYTRSISLDKLASICEFIQMPLGDLFHLAKLTSGSDFELSEENEAFFVENPNHLHFFREFVLHRKPAMQIQREHRLSADSVLLYLRTLEKMGLVEVRGDQYRPTVHGRLSWKKGGPWYRRNYLSVAKLQAGRALENHQNPDVFLSLGAFSLPRRRLHEFYHELESIIEKYKDQALMRSYASSNKDRDEELFIGWNFTASPSVHPSHTEKIPEVRGVPSPISEHAASRRQP